MHKFIFMEHFPIRDRLHTDVLQDRYGSVHVELVQQDNSVRLAHLCDENNISRTFAATLFNQKAIQGVLASVHEQIINGKPIGVAFRESGFKIRKNVLSVFITHIPDELQERFRVIGDRAKVRVSEFITKDIHDNITVYGWVGEVYSPDFRAPSINKIDEAQLRPATAVALENNVSLNELWRGIIDREVYPVDDLLPLTQQIITDLRLWLSDALSQLDN